MGGAYLIGGGCSDDRFSDFTAGLVALGREWYERASACPDSLAGHPAVRTAAASGAHSSNHAPHEVEGPGPPRRGPGHLLVHLAPLEPDERARLRTPGRRRPPRAAARQPRRARGRLVMVPVSPRELIALLPAPARTPIPRTRSAGQTGAADTSIAQLTATAAGTTSRQRPSHDRNLTSHELQLP